MSAAPAVDPEQLRSTLLASPRVSVEREPDVRAGLLSRRTFRTFEHRPVPAALRRSILDAARWALSRREVASTALPHRDPERR